MNYFVLLGIASLIGYVFEMENRQSRQNHEYRSQQSRQQHEYAMAVSFQHFATITYNLELDTCRLILRPIILKKYFLPKAI